MDIATLRDLIIIIAGILFIIILIGTAIALLLLYRQARKMQKNIQGIIDKVHRITDTLHDMASPIISIISMIQSKRGKSKEQEECYEKGERK